MKWAGRRVHRVVVVQEGMRASEEPYVGVGMKAGELAGGRRAGEKGEAKVGSRRRSL